MSEKLKSSDLRSGNYVYICGEIRKCNAVTIANFERGLISAPKPIPLTSEILLACGFEKSSDNEHFFMNYHGFCLVHDGSDYCLKKNIVDDSIICYLSFLHELQNIYALIVKKELEFKTELK